LKITKSLGALLVGAGAALTLAVGAATMTSSCAQTPVNVPVRTFERAQRVDVVCLHVRDSAGNPVTPTAAKQASCAPVAPDQDGTYLAYHLFALVTQTTRGEIAIVDLTAGVVVDIDHATPGINFVPVGLLPTDIAVTPDGLATFVASAEANKPAIYALANESILGDSQQLPTGSPSIPLLTSWPVCALPQAPSSIAIVPRAPKPLAVTDGDGGAADAAAQGDATAEAGADTDGGANAGAADAGGSAAAPYDYSVVVVLPGDAVQSAKVVTLDPRPFLKGAYPSREGLDGVTPIAAGSLAPCPILSAIELGTPPSTPSVATWSDGIPYVDGGVDLSDASPVTGTTCAAVLDGGTDAESPIARATRPHASSAALDVNGPRLVLYVGDDAVPIIHAIDVSDPSNPVELAPLLATSVATPDRTVSVGPIAVSPSTREYQRFLYAVDKKDGSLIVYDVTDPATSPKSPLRRPHPELNPFQPVDRLYPTLTGAPVAALAFVRHDFPLFQELDDGGAPTQLTSAATGLVCNPNPNANLPVDPVTKNPHEQGPFRDRGAYYRPNVVNQQISVGPARLRGIFAFVTLANGQMVTIDVDDWDAPCRRPDPFAIGSIPPPSAIAPAQPDPTSADDLDPYHVPEAFRDGYLVSPVTLEPFFPVAAPHRARSLFLMRNDPAGGNHIPHLAGLPQLYSGTAPKAITGAEGLRNPLMLPTATTLMDPNLVITPSEPNPSKREYDDRVLFSDGTVRLTTPTMTVPTVDADAGAIVPAAPSVPSVRFSFEDPQVHFNQDWAVSYEGIIPGFEGVAATMSPTVEADPKFPPYSTLTLSQPEGLFCRKGVEDLHVGTERAAARIAELTRQNLAVPPGMGQRTADCVQLTDDLLVSTDAYWKEDNGCWDGALTDSSKPQQRYDACVDQFGATLDPANPSLARDFPVIDAFDDRLVVGRYYAPEGEPLTTSTRILSAHDSSNVAIMRRAQCCFHNQARFRVRTGGQWVASGQAIGFLHHVVADVNRACKLSCDPRLALFNSRAPALPRPGAGVQPVIDRNSPLALRNPMFSLLMWSGFDATAPTGFVVPDRDMSWRFTTAGSFSPLVISTGQGATSVSPQSMLFIDSLGQLALVDGASQGLILIDLNTVSIARAPYF
jgi:hypothetical protein